MQDANGTEIKIGDMVVHALAKHVKDWGNPRVDFPKADFPLMSCPFSGRARVLGIVNERVVKLSPESSRVPVFLPGFLEVVSE